MTMASSSSHHARSGITNREKNARALRRLAGDHGALHSEPLPPNFLFPNDSSNDDDLTQLDILLAGPTHTPFATGVWRLHLSIPLDYPQQPPTANFRTPIFHPNVDPQTGGVCVETLKRDWDSKLTLRDVLITISCLLIQPNPDSALNAEAGALIQEDYKAFARRAELMTGIHAGVPMNLKDGVRQAQCRGQDVEIQENEGGMPQAPMRRRRVTARQRGTAPSRRSDGSPSGSAPERPERGIPKKPVMIPQEDSDIFRPAPTHSRPITPEIEEDSTMLDPEQENDEMKSPSKGRITAPRRRRSSAIPLGELTMDETMSSSSNEDLEPEYPPSPRKIPALFTALETPVLPPPVDPTVSKRTPNFPTRKVTPLNNFSFADRPLATSSPFVDSTSRAFPRSHHFPAKTLRGASLFGTPPRRSTIFKKKSRGSEERSEMEEKRREHSEIEKKRREHSEMEEKLWRACGQDVKRWNKGDFTGGLMSRKGGRW